MPQIVKKKVDFPGRGRQSHIDWDSLMDGKTYRLLPVKDFASEPRTVQSAAHQAAKRRGKLCRTKVDNGNVIVQFYAPEAE